MSSVMMITSLILPKHSSSVHWNTLPDTVAQYGMTVYWNLPSSVWNVVKKEEASSSCWHQEPFLQSHSVIMHACANRWAISSGVLKWCGSHTMALLRLVASRHIFNLRFPSLSFPFIKTELLIQGVAWWTGFTSLAYNILSISSLKDSFKMHWDWLARDFAWV